MFAKVLRSICSFKQSKDIRLNTKLYNASKQYDIAILPMTSGSKLDNLHPLVDHIQFGNTFVVGNDKTYIVADVVNLEIPDTDKQLNVQDDIFLPEELKNFFDPIWDKTLQGSQLQFYIVFKGKTYFVNTYPFCNDKKSVIGAIMFLKLTTSHLKENKVLIQWG